MDEHTFQEADAGAEAEGEGCGLLGGFDVACSELPPDDVTHADADRVWDHDQERDEGVGDRVRGRGPWAECADVNANLWEAELSVTGGGR